MCRGADDQRITSRSGARLRGGYLLMLQFGDNRVGDPGGFIVGQFIAHANLIATELGSRGLTCNAVFTRDQDLIGQDARIAI